jgi:DNA/RNA endonuclease G (NUC1)
MKTGHLPSEAELKAELRRELKELRQGAFTAADRLPLTFDATGDNQRTRLPFVLHPRDTICNIAPRMRQLPNFARRQQNFPRTPRITAGLFCLVTSLGFAAAPATNEVPHPRSEVGDADHWTATRWSVDDTALFEGVPLYHGTHPDIILVRYSYYVSAYDADRLCPLWVAHVDVGDTREKAQLRTQKHDPKWKRVPFYPDPNVITFSTARHLPYVVDASYQDPNPVELPGVEGDPTHITRGHNASNEEMKLEGDEDQGAQAQHESFSLANVSPQTQHHNAPLWAALEADCLTWSAKMGRVAVITGPVFAPDASQGIPVNEIIYTNGRKGPQIPIPTHFFKIVVGQIDGRIPAIGFLVPHLSNLGKDDYRHYAVPITQIEEKTALTFLPSETNTSLKTGVNARWLAMLSNK